MKIKQRNKEPGNYRHVKIGIIGSWQQEKFYRQISGKQRNHRGNHQQPRRNP